MIKSKIAVLIDWYLPGTKAGGPVRSVYSLLSVLKNHFDFYLITTNTDLGENQPYHNIQANNWFLKDSIHYYYFSKEQLNQKNMVYVLQHIAPDLIYINSFWSVNFSINIIRLKHQGVLTSPVLLAPRGMLGKGARSLKPLKKNFFIAVAKLFGWYQHVVFHATQNLEEKEIRAVFPAAKIKIAGNINALPIMKNSSDKKISHVRLFYLSRIARVKNLHMALQVLKQLPSNLTAEYHIFGNLEDKIYWQECEKIIESLPTNVSVERKGEISFDKIADVISHYHCLFLPTLNENFGHAIVESLLCGCPVIISDQTPWKDLSAHQAGYALNLNAPEAFVSAISHYANLNQADFIKASESAKQYITAKINISATVEHYKTLFHDCIKN